MAVLSLVLMLGASSACQGDEDDEGRHEAPRALQEVEFERHLRLGIQQLRHALLDSARAELGHCEGMRPQDPDLIIQQARLLLAYGGRPAEETAIGLLRRVLVVRPEDLVAHRILGQLAAHRGDRRAAAAHGAALRNAYGMVGEMEMASAARASSGTGGPGLQFPALGPDAPRAEDYRAFRRAFKKLRRRGTYAPSEAIPVLERLFREYPALVVVRMHYARMLVFSEIRVDYSDRPDLPPMSSALILDLAQSHIERVFDQIHPRSSLAGDALAMLGHIAMLMADYDEAVTFTEILLAGSSSRDDFWRYHTGQLGLARYKQGRHAEAIGLLQEALSGAETGFEHELPLLWLLHLAHEAARTEPEQRQTTFPFRGDLLLAGDPTPIRFEDRAPLYRIDKYDGLGPSAWGDYDRDGDFDLFVTGADSFGALFRNDGGVFADVTREAGLFHTQSGFSATFSDHDGDGWPDLYVGRDGWNGSLENSLLRNNGDGTFTEVTGLARITDPGASFVHQWSDFDRDGDLDLVVAHGITGSGDTNRLYRNEGDGTYTDITESAGLQEPRGTRTIGLAIGDYDDDGWPDLFVSGYMTPNRLYRNRGDGTFEERAAAAHIDGADELARGYVCFFLDYDNDLDLDVLRVTLAPWRDVLLGLSDRFDDLPESRRAELLVHAPKLYQNDGNGTFSDVSEEAGLIHPVGAMGTGVADLDNDGFLDIYFGTGDPDVARMEADRVYRNNGDGTFTDLTFASGLGNVGKGHGVTFIDIDGDGDLEIYVPEGGFVHGDPWANAFYLNQQTTGNHWLHIDLEGTASNRDALDTRVLVTAGGRTLLREKHNGEGFGSSNSPTVEFGLGEATEIERVEIRWPSGETQIIESPPVDRRILVREGEPWRAWPAPRGRSD